MHGPMYIKILDFVRRVKSYTEYYSLFFGGGGLSERQHRVLEIPDLIPCRGMTIVRGFAVLFLSTSI